MNVWEYITLENVLRQHGLEKFFGMRKVSNKIIIYKENVSLRSFQ
jgi:hypothetical protein